eukprot:7281963-Heterocapsa_arctica.AAC.1
MGREGASSACSSQQGSVLGAGQREQKTTVRRRLMDRGNNTWKPSPFPVVVTYADSVVLNIGFTCFGLVAR